MWRSVGSVSNSPVTASTIDVVVVLPARLVFLGPVMVVDGVDHAAGLLRGRAEQHRGLTAVRADFNADAVAQIPDGSVVERAAFVGGHESGDLLGEGEAVAAVVRSSLLSLFAQALIGACPLFAQALIGAQLTVAGNRRL